MSRIIYPVTINNSSLVVVDKQVSLMTETLMAGYNMLNNQDFSGRGNHLSYGGGFNTQGAVLADDAAHIMDTGILEQDNMTIIGCWNLAQSATASSFLNTFDTSGGLNKGFRMCKQANNQGLVHVADGTSSATGAQFNLTFTGAWTSRAIRIGPNAVNSITRGGAVAGTTVAQRGKSSNHMYINGTPSDKLMGSITNGFTGTLGFLLVYNEWTDDATCVSRMNTIKSIMADRSVVIP